MDQFQRVWERMQRHAGEVFTTTSGLDFTYSVPGNHVRIVRDGREINRSLSRTNFAKAATDMPVPGPGSLKDRQGSSYTWVILMDRRIRLGDW